MTDPHVSRVTMLRLSQIVPGFNPRRYFDPKKHDELVVSIRLRGVPQAIFVRPVPNALDTSSWLPASAATGRPSRR